MFSNNIWTFAQQHYVFGRIEKEEEAKKLEAQERRAANAPSPGAKPSRARKGQSAPTEITSTEGTEISDVKDDAVDGNGDGHEHGEDHPECGQYSGRLRTAPWSDPAPGGAAQETEALTGALPGG